MWFPLLVLPLLIYNAVAFDIIGLGALEWSVPLFSVPMVSGAEWTVTMADVLVLFALVLLLTESIRSGRRPGWIFGLVFSGLVFATYVGEFFVVPAAATSLFFTCLAMSFVDFVVRMFASAPPAGPKPPKPERDEMDFNY